MSVRVSPIGQMAKASAYQHILSPIHFIPFPVATAIP
jgi:hypothetical protein